MTPNTANPVGGQDYIDKTNACLIAAGASLHWLKPKSKAPYDDAWQIAPVQPLGQLQATYKRGANIGLRCGKPSRVAGKYLHVLDLDVTVEEDRDEALAALLEMWPEAMSFPMVATGSGGSSRHIYFFTDQSLRGGNLRKSSEFIHVFSKEKQKEVRKRHWEIDIKGTGNYVVIPPSVHPETGQKYRWITPLDLADVEIFGLSNIVSVEAVQSWGAKSTDLDEYDEDDLGSMVRLDPLGLEQHEIDYYLAHLPADWVEDRPTWLTVGMALSHEYVNSDPGYEKWCEWSKQAPEQFNERHQRASWKSFAKGSKNPTTFRSIIHAAKPAIAKAQRTAATIPDDILGLLAPPAAAISEQQGVMRTPKGALDRTLHNAIVFLRRVDAAKGYQIRFNEMTRRDEWQAGSIRDADLHLIRVAIEQEGMRNVGDLTSAAVRTFSEQNKYHPVQEYLATLQHDGMPRLDSWLTRYIGARDTPYTRAVARAFLIAMVARIMRPGCKHDHALVLTGAQGIGKSTICSILGGQWFGDNMPSIRDGAREAAMYLPGHWLVELAEMAPSRKAEAEDLKAFVSRAKDEVREPYGRRSDIVPRQCVFVGTSNDTEFLRDTTGGRRWWPVECGDKIDTEALARDRDQLFAEALAAFNAGEAWHLSAAHEADAREVQEAAREEDPWEAEIAAYIERPDAFDAERPRLESIRVTELLMHLGLPIERQNIIASKRAGNLLRKLGWKRKHTRTGNIWVQE